MTEQQIFHKKCHLVTFLKEYIDESFRENWNITEELLESKAQKLFDELNMNPKDHENLWRHLVDDEEANVETIIRSIFLEGLMKKYISIQTEVDSEDIISELELIGQFALVAYFEDGGDLSHWSQYLHQDDDMIRIFRLQDIRNNL
jgi:hypothetical protein